jgi:hypothetical protein
MTAFQIRALGHDFTALVCMDMWVPVFKKFFPCFINKLIFGDKF